MSSVTSTAQASFQNESQNSELGESETEAGGPSRSLDQTALDGLESSPEKEASSPDSEELNCSLAEPASQDSAQPLSSKLQTSSPSAPPDGNQKVKAAVSSRSLPTSLRVFSIQLPDRKGCRYDILKCPLFSGRQRPLSPSPSLPNVPLTGAATSLPASATFSRDHIRRPAMRCSLCRLVWWSPLTSEARRQRHYQVHRC